jgi:hypothetical protein
MEMRTLETMGREGKWIRHFQVTICRDEFIDCYVDPVTRGVHMRAVQGIKKPRSLPTGCLLIGRYQKPANYRHFLEDLRETMKAIPCPT